MAHDLTGDSSMGGAHDAAMRALEALDSVLGDLVDSPRTRALRNEQGYARSMRTWAESPPGDEERATLLARVHELHDCVLAIRMRHATLASTKVPASR